jgi:hypothetical protein
MQNAEDDRIEVGPSRGNRATTQRANAAEATIAKHKYAWTEIANMPILPSSWTSQRDRRIGLARPSVTLPHSPRRRRIGAPPTRGSSTVERA